MGVLAVAHDAQVVDDRAERVEAKQRVHQVSGDHVPPGAPPDTRAARRVEPDGPRPEVGRVHHLNPIARRERRPQRRHARLRRAFIAARRGGDSRSDLRVRH
eukprot:5237114-Prymnesium_polylepis.1